MSSKQTRYQVFSKQQLVSTGTFKSLKNANTREEAREWKRSASNPSKLAIWDNQSQTVIS
jgi:hypothetical protein